MGQLLTKQDYLNKSKTQKTWATILNDGGAAMVFGGIISYAADIRYYPGNTVGTILMISGLLLLLAALSYIPHQRKIKKRRIK